MLGKRSLIAGSVVTLGLLTALASLSVVSANHQWKNYHWSLPASGSLQVDVSTNWQTGEAGNSDWTPEFDTALADWNLGLSPTSLGLVNQGTGTADPLTCTPGTARSPSALPTTV